jgi:hypothetical protein
MADFEARTNARADILQGSVAELTALLQLVVGQTASDRHTYAAITKVTLEINQDRDELLALIAPPSSLAQLNISPPRQALEMPSRHLKELPPNDITMRPTEIDSSNVTTRYSSGKLSLHPNMPLTIEELAPDTLADSPHDRRSTLGNESVVAKTVLSDASQHVHRQKASILSNESTQSCCSKQSQSRAGRSGQSERSTLTRSTQYNALVSSLQQKAILANDLDKAKIRALDAEVDSFSTYLRQINDNNVDEFLLYTAKIKRRYARLLVLNNGIMERCSLRHLRGHCHCNTSSTACLQSSRASRAYS